jgi:hypothetical protein
MSPQGKDDKGVDILSDRMSDAKLICEEVKAFYRERFIVRNHIHADLSGLPLRKSMLRSS